jgi:hypothetical protein
MVVFRDVTCYLKAKWDGGTKEEFLKIDNHKHDQKISF